MLGRARHDDAGEECPLASGAGQEKAAERLGKRSARTAAGATRRVRGCTLRQQWLHHVTRARLRRLARHHRHPSVIYIGHRLDISISL